MSNVQRQAYVNNDVLSTQLMNVNTDQPLISILHSMVIEDNLAKTFGHSQCRRSWLGTSFKMLYTELSKGSPRGSKSNDSSQNLRKN